jgi:hypothetical protein
MTQSHINRHNQVFSPVWAALGALAIAFAPVSAAIVPRLLPDSVSTVAIALAAMACLAAVAIVWWAIGRRLGRFVAGARRPGWAAAGTGGVAGAIGAPLGAIVSEWAKQTPLPDGILARVTIIGFVAGIVLARVSRTVTAA